MHRHGLFRLFLVLLLFPVAAFPSLARAGIPSAIRVNADVAGAGDSQIGTINVDANNLPGESGFIEAEFELDPDFAFLDEWYDFRWVNILIAETLDGVPVASDSVLGDLPAIDPNPLGTPQGDDNLPFYETDEEFEDSHEEGVNSEWSDDRSDSYDGTVVLTFRTYLVVRSVTDDSIPAETFCVLAGFEWTSTIVDGGESTEQQTLSIISASDADIQQLNDAIDQAPGDGFGDWEATADCTLTACPYIFDCVYSTGPDTTFSESTWTRNGIPIGTTFEGGVTPVPGIPLYDGTFLPVEPNDWHWSVTFDWNGIPTTVIVSVEGFDAGEPLTVYIICSPKFIDIGLSLFVNVANDSYQLSDLAGNLVHNGTWSLYPFDLPASLGFELAGISRANFLEEPNLCPADVTGDDQVNIDDLFGVLGHWGTNNPLYDIAPPPIGNQTVDIDDLFLIVASWGQCPEKPAAPANDDCQGAIPIAQGLTLATNALATTSPQSGPSCTGGGPQNSERDVWFSHVATCNGILSVDTCSTGGAVTDTIVGIYTGVCPNLQEVACDEDACGVEGDTNYLSHVQAPVVAGQMYFIRVSSFINTPDGEFALSVSCTPNASVCGNGIVEPGEQCDDGNNVPFDGCTNCAADPCPPAYFGVPEGAPCFVNGDVPNQDLNGGCNSQPPMFGSINLGQPIAGVISTYIAFDGSASRDTDWYLFFASHSGPYTARVCASFTPQCLFLGNVPACPAQVIGGGASGQPGVPLFVTRDLEGGQAYAVFVSRLQGTGEVPCPPEGQANYQLTLTSP